MAPLLRPAEMLAVLLALAALRPYAANAEDMPQQVGACVACHPMSEVPANSVNPIIWGQNQGYVYLQLRDFKSAARASDSDTAMHALTQTMSDAQMQALAKYVSVQPWPKFADKSTSQSDPLYLRGAKLAAYGACSNCHFNNWQGYSANPRLRGQTPAYLTTTINEFRSGKRENSPGMSDLLRLYDENEVKAIVAYLSSVD